MCLCEYIVSPLLDSTSYITRGSKLVSPGDSQSVLALQYKEIVIFKKLPFQLGSVFFARPICGTAQLEYIFVCMLHVSVSRCTFI